MNDVWISLKTICPYCDEETTTDYYFLNNFPTIFVCNKCKKTFALYQRLQSGIRMIARGS